MGCASVMRSWCLFATQVTPPPAWMATWYSVTRPLLCTHASPQDLVHMAQAACAWAGTWEDQGPVVQAKQQDPSRPTTGHQSPTNEQSNGPPADWLAGLVAAVSQRSITTLQLHRAGADTRLEQHHLGLQQQRQTHAQARKQWVQTSQHQVTRGRQAPAHQTLAVSMLSVENLVVLTSYLARLGAELPPAVTAAMLAYAARCPESLSTRCLLSTLSLFTTRSPGQGARSSSSNIIPTSSTQCRDPHISSSSGLARSSPGVGPDRRSLPEPALQRPRPSQPAHVGE
jgi:hypothetical protein